MAKAELEALALELSRFESVAERVLSLPEKSARVPFTIFVFRDPAMLRRFTQTHWAAGQVLPSLGGYYSVVGSSALRTQTRTVLFHEYMHFLLRKRRDYDYPRWFDEGMSDYMSTLRVRDGVAVIGAAPLARLERVRRRGMVPLANLFESDASLYDCYASAWALVHLMISDRAHRPKLVDLDQRLARGEDPGDASRALFAGQEDSMREEVAAHMERLARGVRHDLALPLAELSSAEVGSVVPAPDAEIGYALGYLQLRYADEDPERSSQAVRFFQTALDGAPDSAHVHAGLAEALAREGGVEAALTHLRRALELQPPGHRVHLHAARTWAHIANRRGDESAWRESKAAAAAAIQSESRSPAAHALLGQALAALGEYDGAQLSLARASQLGAFSPELQLDLAALAVNRGRGEEVRRTLEQLSRDSHGRRVAERAKELLEKLGPEPSTSP